MIDPGGFDINYHGFKVVENDLMTVDQITKTKRSWYTRLFEGIFTSNWAPRRTHNEKTEKGIPDTRLIISEDTIIGHPDTVNIIYELLEKQKNEKGA